MTHHSHLRPCTHHHSGSARVCGCVHFAYCICLVTLLVERIIFIVVTSDRQCGQSHLSSRLTSQRTVACPLLQHHFSAPCTHNPHVLHLHFRATAITIRSTEIIPRMFFATFGTNLHSVLLNPVSTLNQRNIGGRLRGNNLHCHGTVGTVHPFCRHHRSYGSIPLNVLSHYSGNTSVHALTRIFASHSSSSKSGKYHLPPL